MFTASLDRDTVTLGESVTLALNFEGGSPEAAPVMPAIPNLQIAYGGQSSQFNLDNGRMSSTVTYNFSVTPRQVGEFAIPALVAEVNGQRLSSQPLKLTVVRNRAAAGHRQRRQPGRLSAAVLPKRKCMSAKLSWRNCSFTCAMGPKHPAVQHGGAAGGRIQRRQKRRGPASPRANRQRAFSPSYRFTSR